MIHPTVDLSPGHASIPRHQALVYIIMCRCMNTASNEPTKYDEMVISMPQCFIVH